MIEAIGENGYHATRVADVTRRAGVSSRTFYEVFDNKEDCFLTAYDQIAAAVIRHLQRAGEEVDTWPGSAEASIRALFDAAAGNPAAARLSLLEINAVGPAGIERREASIARYEDFVRDTLHLEPAQRPVDDAVLKAVIGGLIRVLHGRVLRGERAKLLAVVPDLVEWATSYHPTPRETAPPRKRPARPSTKLEGGRAPGTLAPHPQLSRRRGLPRGDQNVSRSFVVHSQRERILDAVANITAADGYAALHVERIAEDAAVSLNAFYEHFADKEDAFLVAYEVGHAKGLALVERAYFAESDWRLGVRAGIGALIEFLASEPAFAHLALVDAMIATPLTAERSNVGVGSFAQMLVPAQEEAPGQNPRPPVTIEAIAGGVFELFLHHTLMGTMGEVSELTAAATYVALAPFIAPEEAWRIARASGE
ncbi:MAG TPA: TetR/AcrR family transcriptional regulator [Solirubrobacteraceae bacterium]|jgi:AcrR family transcriptional regulator|nr:TetR/AcrR family transcriptional regulator [Solirubrobacteraceae bacterium]